MLESAGIAVLSLVIEEYESKGKTLHAMNMTDAHERALSMMPAARPADEAPDKPRFFERVGERGFAAWDEFMVLVELLYDSLAAALHFWRPSRRPPKGSVVEQAVLMGVDALLIISLLSFLLGLIIAFQSAYQLQQFGANIYVANLVGISMVREFGPMMTAIIIAGRSGSAIAAELGTMKVQEEIDALKVMGLEPIRYLVLPRLLALTLVQPALTLIADFVGIFGGLIIGTSILDLSASSYIDQTINSVSLGDFGNGLSKSVVFAWIIGITGCYFGLQIRGGASAVGTATTRSVVASIFMIIVADSIFATITTLMTYG
jgi:phospholipid/cholesterol/gamma-HCH transport system permease protein